MTAGLAQELLQKHSNSTQESSQTLCAVLKATLEVLQGEGLEPTPSALFAAVMSSLERPQAHSSPEVGSFCISETSQTTQICPGMPLMLLLAVDNLV